MSSLVVNFATQPAVFDSSKIDEYNDDFDTAPLVEHFGTTEVINAARGVYDINDRKQLLSSSRSPPRNIPTVEHTIDEYHVGSIHDDKKVYIASVDMESARRSTEDLPHQPAGDTDMVFTMDEDFDHSGGFQHYFEVG